MFTGIIEHVGRVAGAAKSPAGRRLEIDPCAWSVRPNPGDSIAVAGCCLTLARPVGPSGLLTFDVVPETLAKTTLGSFAPGRPVNLEHAATLGTLLGGHVVQGHVDGIGTVRCNGPRELPTETPSPNEWILRIQLPPTLLPYMVPKGSVALDGVSLTIAGVNPSGPVPGIDIALIPTTLAKTTLANLKHGDPINVEADVMAKTIVHYLKHFAPSLQSGIQP